MACGPSCILVRDAIYSQTAAAVTADFQDPVLLATDPELAPLQAEPGYKTLLEKLKQLPATDAGR